MFVVALWRGKRRGLDVVRLAAIVGLVGVAAIVGARLVWLLVGGDGPFRSGLAWVEGFDPREGGYASLGGVMGAGLILAVLESEWEADRFRRVLVAVVPAGLIGLAFARFGCLAAGCDFGAVTDTAWGIQYPPGTRVWEVHLAAGLVGPGESLSRAVHPFPLYCIGVTIAAVAVGEFATSRFDATPLVAAVVYLIGRFGVELFREPYTEISLGYGINGNQVLTLVLLAVLCWRGSNPKSK